MEALRCGAGKPYRRNEKGSHWVGRRHYRCTRARVHDDDGSKEARSCGREHSSHVIMTLPWKIRIKCLALTKLGCSEQSSICCKRGPFRKGHLFLICTETSHGVAVTLQRPKRRYRRLRSAWDSCVTGERLVWCS